MMYIKRVAIREKSATTYLLKALVPYSRSNLKLAFNSSAFFNDLSKTEKSNASAARNAYYRAIQKGLIEIDDDNIPRLTQIGRRKIAPFTAKKLKGAQILVVFDIPEAERWKRDHFRCTLREFSFKKIQQSVWTSNLDCREYIDLEIKNLELGTMVKMFEARLLQRD